MSPPKVALAPFLRSCPGVITLGVRSTIDDYSAAEKKLLRTAARVFFPTPRFAYLFQALRIPTFPCCHTYRLQHSRVLQQILLACSQTPHPATRIYFGRRQKERIIKDFAFPLVAMGPLAHHPKQVVDNATALEASCLAHNPLIIQEATRWELRLKILWVYADCLGMLRKDRSQGSDIPYEPLPIGHPEHGTVIELTGALAQSARLDDIVVEWGRTRGQWQVLGMGRPPVRWPLPAAILNRHEYLRDLVMAGRL